MNEWLVESKKKGDWVGTCQEMHVAQILGVTVGEGNSIEVTVRCDK